MSTASKALSQSPMTPTTSFRPMPSNLLNERYRLHSSKQPASQLWSFSNAPLLIQRRLKIGEPDDEYEREADRVAEQVMRIDDPRNRGKAITPVNPTSRVNSANDKGMDAPPLVHEVLRSPGQPLDAQTRAYMEPLFRHDFSKVRVYKDAKAAESAKELDASAYTVGNNIVFGKEQQERDIHSNTCRIAHELVHVVQQDPSNGKILLSRNSGTVVKEERRGLDDPTTVGEFIEYYKRQALMQERFRAAGIWYTLSAIWALFGFEELSRIVADPEKASANDWIVAFWKLLETALKIRLMKAASTIVVKILGKLKGAIFGLLNRLTGIIWGLLCKLPGAVWNMMVRAPGATRQLMKKASGAISGLAKRIALSIPEPLKKVPGYIWDKLEEASGAIWNLIDNISGAIWATVKEASKAIWEIARGIPSAVWEVAKKTPGAVWGVAKKTPGAVWGVAKKTPGAVWKSIKWVVY